MKTTLLRLTAPFAFALGIFSAAAGTPGGAGLGATPGNQAPNNDAAHFFEPVITLEASPDLGDLGYNWQSSMKFETASERIFLRQRSTGSPISHAALRVFDGDGVMLSTKAINPTHEIHVLYLSSLPARDAYKVEMHPTTADGTPKWTPSNWVMLTKAEPSAPIPFQFGDLSIEVFRDDYSVPGMSGAVTMCGGTTMEFIAGVRRHGSGTFVQRGDLWHIGSDTKAMTATLIGMLVEQGLLDWDDTIWDLVWVRGLFPELRSPANMIHPRFQSVTIEHLASHRSGMVMTGAEDSPTRQLYNYMKDPTAFRRETLQSLLTRDHTGIIGEWRYGHGNYMLLGSIIEQVKGKPYERVMVEDLFAPLGMTTAEFGMPTDTALPANLAPNALRWMFGPTSSKNPWVLNPVAALTVSTTAQPNGHRFPNEVITVDNLALPPVWNPAGGVYLSMADWMKFLRLHINGSEGNVSLAPATLAKLQSPYNRPDRMAGPFDAPADKQGDPSYGWGWGIAETGNGTRLGHGGSYGRFNAATQVYVDKGFAVATAANIDGGDHAYGDNAAWGLLGWMVGEALLGCDEGDAAGFGNNNNNIAANADPVRFGNAPLPGRITPVVEIDRDIVLIPARPPIGPAPVLRERAGLVRGDVPSALIKGSKGKPTGRTFGRADAAR